MIIIEFDYKEKEEEKEARKENNDTKNRATNRAISLKRERREEKQRMDLFRTLVKEGRHYRES